MVGARGMHDRHGGDGAPLAVGKGGGALVGGGVGSGVGVLRR